MNANTEVGRSTGRENTSGEWEGHIHQRQREKNQQEDKARNRQSVKWDKAPWTQKQQVR